MMSIGLVGRAEPPGNALSLMDAEEWEAVWGIERLTGVEIPREIVPGFEPSRQEMRVPTVPRRAVRRRAPSHRAWRQRYSPLCGHMTDLQRRGKTPMDKDIPPRPGSVGECKREDDHCIAAASILPG